MPLEKDAFTALRVEVSDHVATITLDRPRVRNALNRAAYREIESVFRALQDDPEIRCVVLTGADPAFCTGEDVKEIMAGEPPEVRLARLKSPTPTTTPAAAAVLDCDRPIICAVNGMALGWGMDLSLFADIRIASEQASFGELFVKRGLVADLGGMWRLPRLVGPEHAARLLFTGETIGAAEALRIGLVSEVVRHAELLPRAAALAASIAANPPLAVRNIKTGLNRGAWGDYRDMGAWICRALGMLIETADHRESVRSFVEKRPPHFVGR